MNVLFRKERLVMAWVAKIGARSGQELFVLACMRVVTPRTAHAHSGMDKLFLEHRFIVAAVAQVGLPGGESLRNFIRYPMRDVCGVYRRVARGAAHGNRGMHGLPFGEFFMALKAVDPGR